MWCATAARPRLLLASLVTPRASGAYALAVAVAAPGARGAHVLAQLRLRTPVGAVLARAADGASLLAAPAPLRASVLVPSARGVHVLSRAGAGAPSLPLRRVGSRSTPAAHESEFHGVRTPPEFYRAQLARTMRRSDEAAAAAEAPMGVRGLLDAYMKLSKFRLGSLVVFTTGAGFVAASGDMWHDFGKIDWARFGWCCLGTGALVAAANTLNQCLEITRDSLMSRTRMRPLVIGRVSVLHALMFASVMSATGALTLATQTNFTTTLLGVFNMSLYAFVYTPMKTRHYLNTWVGAVVGAIPPLMGATAASSNADVALGDLGWDAWSLAGILFSWQITHFLSLAYMARADYSRGGYQMMSTSQPARAAWAALRNALYCLPFGWLAALAGATSPWFLLDSTVLGAFLIKRALPFVRVQNDATSRSLFRASLIYLPLFLAAFMARSRSLDQRKPLVDVWPFNQPSMRAALGKKSSAGV